MATKQSFQRGAIIRASEFTWNTTHGCSVTYPVSRENGADALTAIVVSIPQGLSWMPSESMLTQEMIGVVFQGKGMLSINGRQEEVLPASAFYAPTASVVQLRASDEQLVLYLRLSQLPVGASLSPSPVLTDTLWNNTTVFSGFEGYEEAANAHSDDFTPATMHFIFWPGTGSPHLCLHCGIQETHQAFGIHVHPYAEELFMAFEGQGQAYLDDCWIDMYPGDILYAPPGVYHGARNPGTGRFVTCGGPTPFDPVLYKLAGVATQVC